MLERADAFLPGYIPPVVRMYHLGGHFYGSIVDRASPILVLDRTSFIDWPRLPLEPRQTTSSDWQLACST